MSSTERISRINLLLRRRQGASMAELMEALEASRATVNRDLQYLRDRLNTPVVWDRGTGSYRISDEAQDGPGFQVPGLWLTPAQAYAYLTLHNMVEKIAPALLGPFIEPMRGTLKSLLCAAEFPMYGLDRKIDIRMPELPGLDERRFGLLLDALLHDRMVRLELASGQGLTAVPRKLCIGTDGWQLQLEGEDGAAHTLGVEAIVDVLQT
ncbi:MAG: HTH domain-containing protein [Luteimonas sp.]|nr:HTH domain-containing protein [Luteimonas sp.]